MSEFATFVSSILASPWLAFLVAVWLMLTRDKQHKEIIEAMTAAHKEEMKGMQRTLEKVNTSLRELLDEWRKV